MIAHSSGIFGWLTVTALTLLSPLADGVYSEVKPKVDHNVTLYEHENFEGKSVVLRANKATLTDDNFNDRATSLKWRLPKETVAVLCDHANFKRPVLVIVNEGEVKDLGKSHPNAHDAGSSLAFLKRPKKGDRPAGVPEDIPVLGNGEGVQVKP